MSQLILSKRTFLTGLSSLLMAPAIVKADTLMKVSNIDHILYPMRGLIVYNIGTDTLQVRIDRANFQLSTPKVGCGVEYILTDKEIKKLFLKDILNSLIPDKPYIDDVKPGWPLVTKNIEDRQQKFTMKEFSALEWSEKGLLPALTLWPHKY